MKARQQMLTYEIFMIIWFYDKLIIGEELSFVYDILIIGG